MFSENPKEKEIFDIISSSINQRAIKKIVFSMAVDKAIKKAEASLFVHKDQVMVCIQYFTSDNKAIRKNFDCESAVSLLCDMAMNTKEPILFPTSVNAQ